MFIVSLKKLYKNKWLTLCLLLGCFLIVSVASSIPTYTTGIFSKVLVKEMESVQKETNRYPGIISIAKHFSWSITDRDLAYKSYQKNIQQINETLENSDLSQLGTIHRFDTIESFPFMAFELNSEIKSSNNLSRTNRIIGAEHFEDYINIVKGEMYRSGLQDGCYEVVVNEVALKSSNLVLGKTYQFVNSRNNIQKNKVHKIKIVGVYEIKNPEDPFWYEGYSKYEQSAFVMDYDTFLHSMIESDKFLLTNSTVSIIFDYHNIKINNVTAISDELKRIFSQLNNTNIIEIPIQSKLDYYSTQLQWLEKLIFILYIPLCMILLFYIFTMAKLFVGYDENEIAILKSRGATTLQIARLYVFEFTIISAVALILGIPFGMYLAKFIGYSNGFLTFVNRTAIESPLHWNIIFYGLVSAVIFLLVSLIPVMFACKKNILSHKQQLNQKQKMPVWRIACFDVILLVMSFYGLYLYNKENAALLESAKGKTSDNPLIFIMSSCFICGACLLVLRIYPYLIKLVHWIGRKFWPAAIHVSMLNLSRNRRTGSLLVLFLTFTISTGVFNAATARSINKNQEDQIKYSNGCDIILEVAQTPDFYASVSEDVQIPVYTTMMPITPIEQLDGVEAAAKVYSSRLISTTNIKSNSVHMLAVQPYQFSKVVWSRNDINPYHINEYLNALAENPKGCFVSKELLEKENKQIGETISVEDKNFYYQRVLQLTILGTIDRLPGYELIKGNDSNYFILSNFDYIFSLKTGVTYQAWVKLKEDATTEQFYQSITDNKILLNRIVNTQEQVIQDVKNNPNIQGLNGTLSLSFILSLVITCTGMLLYWVIDVKSRLLQFSVLRSMGVSKHSLNIMLAFEQILVSGFALIAGLVIGGLASTLFVHPISMFLNVKNQLLPFITLIQISDYVRILTVVFILLIVCLATIMSIVNRLNIASTLKLGED